MSKALLAVMMQPPAHLEEEFNDWYDTEHLADRAASPGFESSNRYDSVTGGPQAYLTLYDLEDIGTLETPDYKLVSGSNFTPWTKRLMRRIPRYRLLAEQIYPGDAVSVGSPFLTLVRISNVSRQVEASVVALAKVFAEDGRVRQARVFKETLENEHNFLIVLASTNRVEQDLDFSKLGEVSLAIDFVRTFIPHKAGWSWEKSI